MKKKFLLFVILFISISAFAQTKKMGTEEAAIRQTLHDETAAFYQRNYDLWASHWVQDETVFHGWNNRDGTYTVRNGWEALSTNIAKYIREHPEPNHAEFEYKSVQITIVGDLAYVSHDEFPSDKSGEKFTHTKGFKVLRKVDGKWKLVSVCSYWNYEYDLSKGDF